MALRIIHKLDPAAARAQNLVPQSGDWAHPDRWIRAKRQHPAFGPVHAPELGPNAQEQADDMYDALLHESWANLSYDEQSAINTYSTAMHDEVNNALRDGEVTRTQREIIRDLDSATSKTTLPEPVLVLRGVSEGSWPEMEDAEDGEVVKDPGFFSTSLSRRHATKFGKTVEILLPVGTKYSIGHFSDLEVLLPRNSRFKVHKVRGVIRLVHQPKQSAVKKSEVTGDTLILPERAEEGDSLRRGVATSPPPQTTPELGDVPNDADVVEPQSPTSPTTPEVSPPQTPEAPQKPQVDKGDIITPDVDVLVPNDNPAQTPIINKTDIEKDAADARARGLVPQSGDWDAPVRWVKPDTQQGSMPPTSVTPITTEARIPDIKSAIKYLRSQRHQPTDWWIETYPNDVIQDARELLDRNSGQQPSLDEEDEFDEGEEVQPAPSTTNTVDWAHVNSEDDVETLNDTRIAEYAKFGLNEDEIDELVDTVAMYGFNTGSLPEFNELMTTKLAAGDPSAKAHYQFTQDRLAEQFPDGHIKVYRGITERPEDVEVGHDIGLGGRERISSWSLDPSVSRIFIGSKGKGMLVEATVPISMAVSSYHSWPDSETDPEHEITLLDAHTVVGKRIE